MSLRMCLPSDSWLLNSSLRSRQEKLKDSEGNDTSRSIVSIAAEDIAILTWPHLRKGNGNSPAAAAQPETDDAF